MLKHCGDLNNLDILEPSAGTGNLVDGILKHSPAANVDCIELNRKCRLALKDKGYNVIGSDFLRFNSGKKYDYIIACPTYKNNIDVVHIMHMYDLLKPGGCIVSLTSPYWVTNNDTHQVEFRSFLADKEYKMVMLTDNSFVEEYQTQPSMIIKIYK